MLINGEKRKTCSHQIILIMRIMYNKHRQVLYNHIDDSTHDNNNISKIVALYRIQNAKNFCSIRQALIVRS